MYRLATPFPVTVILALSSTSSLGQDVRPHRPSLTLSLHVEIEGAVGIPQTPALRLYSVPAEIVASIGLFNVTTDPSSTIIVDREAFRRNIHVALEQPRDLGVTVRWLPFQEVGTPRGQTAEPTRVSVSAGRGTALRAAITPRTGERWSPGTYTLRVELDDIASVAPGAAANQILKPRPHVISLRMADPQTIEERANASRRLGRAAMTAGRFEEAEAYLRRAADEAGGVAGLTDLGEMYLHRGKYREAIEYFERVMPTLLQGSSAVPQMLAEAYVGVGDEPRALQVLDRVGMPASRIATELERYRDNVSRRTPR